MSSFVIDSLPESAGQYRQSHALVVVDVFRATTVVVTALSCGHRVYPVATLDEAMLVAGHLPNVVFAGEQDGVKPGGFDLNNSPVGVEAIEGSRSIVLLTSAGTKLLAAARGASAIYVACLRNLTATTELLVASHTRVALIGAGTRGMPRPEDQLVCAWIGDRLQSLGWTAENERTVEEVERYRGASVQLLRSSPSARYLEESDQVGDLEFVLSHVDDVNAVGIFNGQQVSLLPAAAGVAELAAGDGS